MTAERATLRRRVGHYATPDGRFVVQAFYHESFHGGERRYYRDGWIVTDTTGALVFNRGRFHPLPRWDSQRAATIDAARVLIAEALRHEAKRAAKAAAEVPS